MVCIIYFNHYFELYEMDNKHNSKQSHYNKLKRIKVFNCFDPATNYKSVILIYLCHLKYCATQEISEYISQTQCEG